MHNSDQVTAPTPSPQHRHLVVARGDAEATERSRIAGIAASYAPTAADTAAAKWLETRPDLLVPLLAETFVSIGASPEALGLDPDLTAQISEAMAAERQAARTFRPPLYAVPDPRPEPTRDELDAATATTAAVMADPDATPQDRARAAEAEATVYAAAAAELAVQAEAETEAELEL